MKEIEEKFFFSIFTVFIRLLAGHQPIFRKQKDCPKYDACWTLDSGMEKREIGFIAKEGSQGKLWDCTIVASAVSRCAASGDVVGGDGFISVSI